MKKKAKDFTIIGFMIFSLFFGAGNLIFPPKLGQNVGNHFYLGIIGFCLTGVLLPMLGLLTCMKCNGNFEELCIKCGKNFTKIFSICLVLLLGPLIALPRAAAITYSIAIKHNFPSINIIEFLIVFLLLLYFLVVKKSGVIEIIGKYLTPILLIVIFAIIIKGIITPISGFSRNIIPNDFSLSLQDGYQTMDTIGSVLFASIVTASIKSKGYKNNEVFGVILKSSTVAIILLCAVYGGLVYLGSRTGNLANGFSDSDLLLFISDSTLGKLAVIAIEIVLAIGCLASSVGLLAASGSFFVRISNNKIKYNVAITAILVVTGITASIGLTNIISVSTVVLNIVYPATIVVVVLNILRKFIVNHLVYKICTYITLIISFLEAFPKQFGFITKYLPLSSQGFGWVLPFIIILILSNYFLKFSNYKVNINK